MTARPHLRFWSVWNMSFGFLGMQFGLALQNANLSRIFQTLGADIDDIAVLWIAAPLTGLIVQPIVGYFSDRTWTRLGRRRPYFLGGAIVAALALAAMPNSPSLWIAAGLLWVLDGAINVAMGPFRAFVGDQLPAEQRPFGFAMQTFFICVGSIVASLLPWWLATLGIANTGAVPQTVKVSFYLGAVALFGALAWTVVSTREYPPEAIASFERAPLSGDEPLRRPSLRSATGWLVGGGLLAVGIFWTHADRKLFVLALLIAAFGALLLGAASARRSHFVSELVADLYAMPTMMRRLAAAQLFSWFALFAMWTYTTAAVTEVHFAARGAGSTVYNDGANWTGVLFAAYNAFAMLAAALIPPLSRRWGLRATHAVNLAAGGIGLLSFLWIRDPAWLLVSMAGVGFAWASILSVPYALLSDSVPAHKMGAYMGIFNLFIVVPQMLAASLLGFVLKSCFGNAPIAAIGIAGVCFLLGGVATLRIGKD
ncbi:MAG TPA: MFS transporter [Rudaea sp.]